MRDTFLLGDRMKTVLSKNIININLLYTQSIVFIVLMLVIMGVKWIKPELYNVISVELITLANEKTSIEPIVNNQDNQSEPEISKPTSEVAKDDDSIGEEDSPSAEYAFDLGLVRQMSATSNGLTQMSMPIIPKRISSPFGYRVNPVTGNYGIHGGLDMSANTGTVIKAALPGKVLRSKYSSDYGNFVTIDHGDGLVTLYAHCSKLLVEVGDKVRQGDAIALVGSTGRSTGPHLHFEVRINDVRINPQYFLTQLNEA